MMENLIVICVSVIVGAFAGLFALAILGELRPDRKAARAAIIREALLERARRNGHGLTVLEREVDRFAGQGQTGPPSIRGQSSRAAP
jgi:hypothetical protein